MEIEEGTKIKGFRFQDRTDGIYWNDRLMSRYIGEVGKVMRIRNRTVTIRFEDGVSWSYPESLAHKHIVNESEITNNLKQIEMKNFIIKLQSPTDGYETLMHTTLINYLTRINGGVALSMGKKYYGIKENGKAYAGNSRFPNSKLFTLDDWYNTMFLPSIMDTDFCMKNGYNDSRRFSQPMKNIADDTLYDHSSLDGLNSISKFGFFITFLNKFNTNGSLDGNSAHNYYCVRTMSDGSLYFDNTRNSANVEDLIELNLKEWWEVFIGRQDKSTILDREEVELYNGTTVMKYKTTVIINEASAFNGKYMLKGEVVNINGLDYATSECIVLASGSKIPEAEATEENGFITLYDGMIERGGNPYVHYGFIDETGEKAWFYATYNYILVDEDGDEARCISESVAQDRGGLYISDDGKYYMPEIYETRMEELKEDEHNNDYHSGSRECRFNADTAKYTIGFEIEKEDGDAVEIGWYKLKRRTGWDKERDGSLNDYTGYELVSPAFNLFTDDIDKEINADEDLQILIDAETSSSCGGHINLGSTKHSPSQLFQLIEGWLPLFYTLYEERISGEYCKAKEKYKYAIERDKYSAIFVKSSVVEFRIPSAVKSVKNLLWRRDLMRIICSSIKEESVKGIEGTAYIGATEIDVLKMLVNPTSELHQHLRKIYSHDKLLAKINRFVHFADNFNSASLPRIDADQITNHTADATEELGA